MSASDEQQRSQLAADLHIQATYRLTEALVASENRMRRRVELLSEIVFETDAAGQLVFLNNAWEKALGHPSDRCLGKVLTEFVLPEDQASCAQSLAGLAPAPTAGRNRLRFCRADGSLAWMEISVAQIAGGVVGTLHDVTAEKKAGDELAKLSLVASYTDNYVIITDREGRTEWVNQAFINRTGYKLEDMLGHKPGEILQGPETDPVAVELVKEALAEGRSFKAELLNYTRTGEAYWVSFQISPIRDAEGRVERFVSIQSDSTARRRAQRELEAAKEHAERMAQEAQVANRAKSEFLANMSHEIRTPMNGILGMAELLHQTSLTAQQREFTHAITESGGALLNIINDILDLSRMEAGRMTLGEQEFELRALVEGVIGGISQSSPAKPVRLRVEWHGQFPGRVRGDAGRLRQVLSNLVGNGFKFTATGEVVTRVHARKTPADRVRLRFEVVDTGMGIPEDKLALLFKSFQQVDASSTRRHGGTGLGLAISWRLVELMGGRMGVTSAAGKGSLFWFEIELPLVSADLSAREDLPRGRKVFVLQTNALDRRLTLLTLEKLGCQPVIVNTPGEFLEILRRETVETLLFDPRLTEMEGREFAASIRREELCGPLAGNGSVRLIALANRVTERERERFRAGGIDVILDSPPALARLREELVRDRSRGFGAALERA